MKMNKSNINEMKRRRTLYQVHYRRAWKGFILDAPDHVIKQYKQVESQRKQYI